MVVGSKNLKLSTNTCSRFSFQKNVLPSFLLFLSACYQDDLSDSERNEIASYMACNFNNSWLLYVKFSETINLCRNIWLIGGFNWKIGKCQLFLFFLETKGLKRGKIFNFLKGSFSVMRGSMDMILGILSETYIRVLTSITSQFASRYSKSYNNLNVKNYLKLNGS